MTTDCIIELKKIIQDSEYTLAALSESGKNIIGYFCTYTPVEVIHACGFLPVRITGGYGHTDKAYQHVPDFICPYMKRALEKAMNGQYHFLSGLIQGYTCDTACGMVNVWKEATGIKMVHSLPVPYNSATESKNYFRSVLDELIVKMNTIGGAFNLSALNDSLNLYHRIRSIQYTLYRQRYKSKSGFSASEFMTLMDAGSVMPPEDYLAMLEKLSERLPEGRENKTSGGVPVIISGSIVERPELMDMIELSGGQIVADDLCNGLRQILPTDGQGETAIDRLIDRYMNRFPCPSRSRAADRGRRLIDLLDHCRAKGVIFVLQKFCTPHLADIPILSETLKQAGYRSIVIEMDETWDMAGQVKTRLEGFFEMIE